MRGALLEFVSNDIHGQGTVSEFSADDLQNRTLQRCLRQITADDELNDAEFAEVSSRISLTNALSEVTSAPSHKSSSRVPSGKPMLTPPPGAFEGFASKMVPLTEDGGILKLTTVFGYAECEIKDTDYVTLNYCGWLNGRLQPFTSTQIQKKPMEREIGGVGAVFIGLDLCLLSMKKGEHAYFLTCPAYSYGMRGTKAEEKNWPEITGEDWILWKIEVVNVIAAAEHVEDIFMMNPDDRVKLPFSRILQTAEAEAKLAKEAFLKERWSPAKKLYGKAAKLLVEERIFTEEEVVTRNALLSKIFGYIALTIYKQDLNENEEHRNYQDMFDNAEMATKFDEKNARAWFWGGVALRHLYRLEESREFLAKAASLNPGSSEIGNEQRTLDKDFIEQRVKEKALLQKMVGVDKDGQAIRKIPPHIANAVNVKFRERVDKQLSDLVAGRDELNFVNYDLKVLNKCEEAYVNAALQCSDASKLSVRRFRSQLGGDIIRVEGVAAP